MLRAFGLVDRIAGLAYVATLALGGAFGLLAFVDRALRAFVLPDDGDTNKHDLRMMEAGVCLALLTLTVAFAWNAAKSRPPAALAWPVYLGLYIWWAIVGAESSQAYWKQFEPVSAETLIGNLMLLCLAPACLALFGLSVVSRMIQTRKAMA